MDDVLCSDYGLAPETQYPVSLNECAAVYKWILEGGLGFHPGKIALFGESAGTYRDALIRVQLVQLACRH